jgi:hypothetical protein
MDHILNFDAFEGIDYEKRQELLILREHLSSAPLLVGPCFSSVLCFLLCVCPILPVLMDCPIFVAPSVFSNI